MKKKKIRNILIVLLAIVLVAGAGLYGIYEHFYGMIGKTVGIGSEEVLKDEKDTLEEDSPEEEKRKLEESLKENLEAMRSSATLDEHLIHLVFVGVDSRNDDLEGRSDTMIVFTINKDTKKMVMTSLMRDCYVTIPGYGNNRLNAAYAFGGAELLYDTVEANFGIPVDKCIVVNFQFVAEMVDSLGGVDLTLSKDEVRVMNDYIRSINKELYHVDEDTDIVQEPESETVALHLNGKQATAYCRNRYTGTDYDRTERQRKVITQCLEIIRGMNLFELNGLAEELLPEIGTDLSRGDVAGLLFIMADYQNYTLEQFTIPEPGTSYNLTIDGMMVLGVDFEKNRQKWMEMIE